MIGFVEKIRDQKDCTYITGRDSGDNAKCIQEEQRFADIATDEDVEVVEDALVYLYGPSRNLIGSTFTNWDGSYGFSHQHSGAIAV